VTGREATLGRKSRAKYPVPSLAQACPSGRLTLVYLLIEYLRVVYPSEALNNVTQTHGYTPRHDDLGGSHEPEDGSHGARQRRSDYGKRWSTCTADAVEKWWSAGSPNAVEEWWSTGTANALEVRTKVPLKLL
jgi:hypothetical protein